MKIKSKEEFIINAIKVFTREGLQGTSVSSIAKEMNIAKGALYYYFKSKDELIHQCIDYVVERSIKGLKEGIDFNISFREYISQIVKNSMDLPKDFPEGLIFLELYMHTDFYNKSSFLVFSTGIFDDERIQKAPDYKYRKVLPAELMNTIVTNIFTIVHRYLILFPESLAGSSEKYEKCVSEMIWQIFTGGDSDN